MRLGTRGMAAMLASGLCAALSGCAGMAPGKAEYYGGQAGLPFSEAVQVGEMLYLSGQIGTTPGTTTLAPGGMSAEAVQTMENIRGVLDRRGLTFDDVVKCTVMLADMADWPAFNTVYVKYFKPGRLPARSAFGATGLAYGARLEVECWAHVPANTKR